MERISGKRAVAIDGLELTAQLAGHAPVVVDIGTGDGRYVVHLARQHPASFVIGIDACREELRTASRTAPSNALFLIANVLALPPELRGLAERVTIHFPWGSLLDSLLAGDPALLDGLTGLLRPGATLTVLLNADALARHGCGLAEGGERARWALSAAGLAVGSAVWLDAAALRALPTTWAKRLAFGRDPRALALHGKWPVVSGQWSEIGMQQSDRGADLVHLSR
jgi:16S rRNA (adenine(1408)-N(1))-methyltransferase